MHWKSQDDYLRILRKFPKNEMFGVINNDLRQNAGNMLSLAELLKSMNDGNSILTREKLCDDNDLIEVVNMLIERVLTDCPSTLKILGATGQRLEDEVT